MNTTENDHAEPESDRYSMNGLDQEEQALLQAFEAGELRRAADFAEIKKRHQEYAEAMLMKKEAEIK
ncbi:MAG: hypothetical protein H6937_05965 [Burkholderiales bacterium]|nr:hypothetical protein [Burkholderiales bacterium]